ncbi:ABC transporter permease [Halopelagius longus]|uniref:ABC transporter permease n=1 Tax=Halopelagius longus TaxID=1236180 RepID=A0A1H1FBW2_9EURY|nr:ABC transporter permease [Halopelagius longus]SDQ98465.1 monosaccharide ABC transporter membrane protein, CUT2 family [Halopelagius longus]
MSLTTSHNSDRTSRIVPVLLEHMIWPILVVAILVTAVLVPELFANLRSFELVLYSSVPLGLLVLAESICLLTGHFDLSIGAIAGFSAMFTGMVIGDCASCWGVVANPYAGIVLILAVGGLIGVLNGVMIAKLGVNPFLQTLAFLIIFSGAKTAMNTQPVTGLPKAYLYLGGQSLLAIGILVVVFAAFAFVMRYTNFGQSVYAVGSDEESARAVGINTDRVIITVYAISGILAGLAGLILTGYTTIVAPDIAENMVFPAFAAAVIGGISLFGGRGLISGALGGLLLLGIVQTALNLSGVAAAQVEMANGIVLLVAILLYNMKESIRTRVLSGGST